MRRAKTIFIISFLSLLLVGSSICHGYDTDLYVLSGVNIPPNVIIIMDSSASMDEVSSGQNYDPAIDYSLYGPGTIYPGDEVYYKSGKNWVDTTYTTSSLPCPDLVNNYLLPYGMANNYSGCGYSKKDFQTGNYRNFLQLNGGPGGSRPRFGLQDGVIHSYINTTRGVRFAVMTFNTDKDGNKVTWDGNKEKVFGDNRDDPLDAVGGKLLGFVDENKNGKTALFNTLAGYKNETWSPLAETLYEAGVYLQGKKSDITGTQYTSPVQYYCQKNYVLIISDGDPTKDSDSTLISAGIQDLNGDKKIDLDEVAKYLYNMDLSDGKSPQKQNIKTYTIGFSITKKLLEDTAKNGGGKYFYVWSSQSFNIAFQTFIAEVLEESVSYVAPVVPISQMERTSAGNLMYLAMFKPTEKSFWKGNIKKYCIATKNSSGEIVDCSGSAVSYSNPQVGDILDVNGSPVMDSNNEIKKTARSFWSSDVDGGYTDMGGVGEVLLNRASSRNIYTYLGINVNLTDSSNSFSESNITPTRLGLASGDTVGRDNLVKFIYGYDAYYQNELPPQGPTAKRDWILGAFIHSRPVVIHYEDRTVIYSGANDGMIHAFDDQYGEELWAFIPPNLLSNLKNLTGEALQFFVDGPPKAYVERDSSNKIVSAILIFGERRGGDRYIALDITNPLSPQFLWEIGPSTITYKTTVTNTTAYQEFQQTWSAPQLGKIIYGAGEKWVAFISGGYDANQDNQPVVASDINGRAIYVVDILNGNLIWSYSYAKNPNMKYCIPSDIARVDTDGNGYIDRLYVGDIGGQVWRFDIGDSNISNWDAKVTILFDANKGESLKRKIFYPPEVTLEKEGGNYEMIFFGTGDREHPKETTKVDRLYAIKDKNPSSALSESNLVNVTQDWLQEGNESQKTWTLNQLSSQQGWFIELNQNLGEKCLSNSVIFYGDVYYTTFQPTFDPTGSDPCFLGEGIARVYALGYKTGNAVFNLDGVGTLESLTRSDRSTIIGTSIPSGVIVTFVGGTSVAYGGVGGGVYRPPLPIVGTIIPINWRIVF
jgi:type IV pilus assembly protein PilY1